ncbi:uncharacterized protein DUF998 [Stackebrandtia albiflava]|uniref:Uncharacterized protein DUF998 n=1 Tax=Stackebrandtia albiflava TaxID=406432 RepID=A0A562UR76_9ACTN|nr:DUF998 domain-containing protein [Stackebrandtia albiflava]TWJ08123.1 uncharacterized protein DUF998 [Stackebrandtia albiflava]
MPEPQYIAMAAVMAATAVACLTWRDGRPRRIAGVLAWLLPLGYILVEVVAISAGTVPYDPSAQPMSDLGVTTCGTGTYPLADYPICSPLHDLVNWANVLAGTGIAAGAMWLRGTWPPGRRTTAATVLLVVFGLCNAIPGLIPADVDFVAHVAGTLPGMVVQIPALFLLAAVLRRAGATGPARWTTVCATATTLALVLIPVQPFLDLPGGLLQRALYFSVYLWAAVAGVERYRATRPAPLMAATGPASR